MVYEFLNREKIGEIWQTGRGKGERVGKWFF